MLTETEGYFPCFFSSKMRIGIGLYPARGLSRMSMPLEDMTFTFGRRPPEVFIILNQLSEYLKDNLATFAPNWLHTITADPPDHHILTIYQFDSSQLGVLIPRTIQMFTDQTIKIRIDSKDCTHFLMTNLRIETPETLKELIEKVADASVCIGCPGFETIIRCRRSIREGNIWYSSQCTGLISSSLCAASMSQVCRNCRATRLSLRNQKAKMMSTLRAKDKEQVNAGSQQLTDLKNLSVQNIIQERLEGIWNALGFDEKWKDSIKRPEPNIRPSNPSLVNEVVTIDSSSDSDENEGESKNKNVDNTNGCVPAENVKESES